MVSIPRSSVRESDSEDNCDSEEDGDYETGSDESPDSDEERRSDTPEEDSEEGDDASTVEAEKEDMRVANHDEGRSASHEVRERPEPPPMNVMEGLNPQTVELAGPSLHMQDAQNPIFEMSPQQASTIRRTPL